MNLCKNTLKIETKDLLVSVERYVEYFLELLCKYDYHDPFEMRKEDIVVTKCIDDISFNFNRFAYFLDCNNPALRKSFFTALRNRFDYRKFFSIEERRDFYQYIKLLDIEFKVISRGSSHLGNNPDFVLDGVTGVEVVHYKDPISGQFYKYLYPHKKDFMICEDLVKHMGKNAPLLFKRINPTVSNGVIYAWSEPLSNVYTVDCTYKMALNRISGKLEKYNKAHYVKYEENILLVRLYFDINKENLHRLHSIIIDDYPIAINRYKLKLVFFTDYTIVKIDLSSGDYIIKKY